MWKAFEIQWTFGRSYGTSYEQQGFCSGFYLQKEFYWLRFADYAKSNDDYVVSPCINAHRSLCRQLRNDGATIDNDTKVSVLFFGLGNSKKALLMLLWQSKWNLSWTPNQPSLGWRSTAKRCRSRSCGYRRCQYRIGALFKSKRPQQSDRDRQTCNYCYRNGHRKDYCWVLNLEDI